MYRGNMFGPTGLTLGNIEQALHEVRDLWPLPVEALRDSRDLAKEFRVWRSTSKKRGKR